MMNALFRCLFLMILCVCWTDVIASEGEDVYLSLKHKRVNMRTGPSTIFPIKWVYQKQFIPVKVLDKSGGWIKISDIDGEEGWIQNKLLSAQRYVISMNKEKQIIYGYATPEDSSYIRMKVENMTLLKLLECSEYWCKIYVPSIKKKAWVRSRFLWGVNEGESKKLKF